MMGKRLHWVANIFLLGVCGLTLVCAYWYWYGRFFTNKELEALDEVDQIKIVVGGERGGKVQLVKMIDDPQEIEYIVSQLRIYSNHWQYESFGPPETGVLGRPTSVGIVFYNKGKIKTTLGVGYSKEMSYFLKRIQEGRYLEYEEFKEIMELLELDEKEAYYD